MQPETRPHSPRVSTRRGILLGGGALVVAGSGVFASKWFNIFASAAGTGALTVENARAQAEAGEIYLIDIRRPDEWAKTGIAQSAIPIDMRRDDFEDVLRALFAKTGEKPVALICARGVRSDRMNERLEAAGFGGILDVPEGMLGSGAGPGYLERGLPVRAPTQAELDGSIG
ncbi:rhodanese-like domain-containing protein [Jannaschia sp.]|nr:rhodanese-like domain-containing protein [Jannaschia sp.]